MTDDARPVPRSASPASPAGAAGAAWVRGILLVLAVAGVVVVAWVCLTAWGAVRHAHPAYPVWLALLLVASLVTGWRARRPRRRRTGRRRAGWRRAGRVVVLLLLAAWIAATAWLRPLGAVEPALTAMGSDAVVEVAESSTRIVLTSTGEADPTGVLFQPGALVDARAYAAVLRPLAEAGHPVVIVKQPLGIAFLSLSALDGARSVRPDVDRWVLGGHSLGGVVAAMEADSSDEADPSDDDGTARAAGLFFYASYPAGDVSGSLTAPVLSLSGSEDGLSTPAKVDASRADLPADATLTVVEGASHASFGDYGPQSGDGTPTIGRDDAREQISQATLAFVDSVD